LKNCRLVELIRSKIERDGPVSFAWFMEQALYHPEHGYYSSGRAKLGRTGDYFTNVSVGPLFGKLLAAQFEEIWRRLGKPDDFSVVEQGAHEGELATDVLSALETDFPACFDGVRYLIVEPFAMLRTKQKESLTKFAAKTEWRTSFEDLEPFMGVHFSNELLDAMPVHLARSRSGHQDADTLNTGQQWLEKYIDWQAGEFAFVERPVGDTAVGKALGHLPPVPDDFEIEINLAALDWIEALAQKLERGYILTVDYGYLRDDLTNRDRHAGTLRCRAEHRIVDSPLDRVGSCDITAHVNWTALADCAQQNKFRIDGFVDQHHFLTGIISERPEFAGGNNAGVRRQLQTLLHPEMMGRSFQVLALSRGIDSGVPLSGFKFGRPADRELGIDSRPEI
jgi:SAM-dependent MidA family methyltransferase